MTVTCPRTGPERKFAPDTESFVVRAGAKLHEHSCGRQQDEDLNRAHVHHGQQQQLLLCPRQEHTRLERRNPGK